MAAGLGVELIRELLVLFNSPAELPDAWVFFDRGTKTDDLDIDILFVEKNLVDSNQS